MSEMKYLVQGYYCKKWQTYVECGGNKDAALHQLMIKRVTQPDIKWRLNEERKTNPRQPSIPDGD